MAMLRSDMKYLTYLATAIGLFMAQSVLATDWQAVDATTIADDDLQRHANDPSFLSGITVMQTQFSENGFNWNLIQFSNASKPDGPLFVVPHDDENAGFESMIAALKLYGGTGVSVNSGQGSARMQSGYGRCGVKAAVTYSCDPNRNFSNQTQLYTAAIMDLVQAGQPVIAYHTNSVGFAGDGKGGSGDISILDMAAARKGKIRPRSGGYFAINPPALLDNPDTLGLIPYTAISGAPSANAIACRVALNKSGVNFWAERVRQSDGSLSNYIALSRPDIAYFNAESRRETDLAVASQRHLLMTAAYLAQCVQN